MWLEMVVCGSDQAVAISITRSGDLTMSETVATSRNSEQAIVVPVDALNELVMTVFVKKTMYPADAELGSQRLIEADLRGIHSHGTRALKSSLEAIDTGDIDPRAHVLTLNDTPAMAVLDGGKGLGHVVASRGMKLAIDKARAIGTGTVAVRNGQYFGAASVYVLMAVNEGMIGYCTTSSGPATVAAYGSRQPATANNAIAWGVPTRSEAPFILDMDCAVSSWEKVGSLKKYGETLPDGWALDKDGNQTADPAAAKTLNPAAGARGYGLAFLSSVLAGPLVGGKMPFHKTRSPVREVSEHFFYAIDPSYFGETDEFYERLETAMTDIRALEPADGFDKVRLPGDLEWEQSERWKRDGIPLQRDHVQMLDKLAHRLKIDVPW